MPLAISLNPNQLSTYWRRETPIMEENRYTRSIPVPLRQAIKKPEINEENPRRGMSRAAQKRIKRAINWLTYLSASRTERLPSGRVVPRFQVSFITLTLPSKQRNSHKEIKSRCLNNFLQVMRDKYKMRNYVWKAELQSNGNIHFHITTDVFVHYQVIRRVWNKSINLFGYVDSYANKMKRMSYEEYKVMRKSNSNVSDKSIRKAFNYGEKTEWKQPNSTDVHSVKNVKNLAAYMAKYMTKDVIDENSSEAMKQSASTLKGRLWYCSQSLSRLKNVQLNITRMTNRITRYLRKVKEVFVFNNDFVECFFFKANRLHKGVRSWLREQLVTYAMEMGYPFVSPIHSIG